MPVKQLQCKDNKIFYNYRKHFELISIISILQQNYRGTNFALMWW